MELFQLRYFVAAAQTLHFTRAAVREHVSQPSLSQQISNLEAEVGAKLFLRQRRGVELTEAGRLLLSHAERILEDESAALRDIRALRGSERGQLTVWTLPTPGEHMLPPILAEFRRRHPHIDIQLREMVPANLIAAGVQEGRADFGIVQMPCAAPSLAVRLLLDEELALVVPEEHRFAGAGEVGLSEAANEEFISAPEGQSGDHPLYRACLDAGFTPKISCVSGSAHGMQALVAAGLGIALLPRMAISPPRGTIAVNLKPPRPRRILAAVWQPGRITPSGSEFLRLLVDASAEPESAGVSSGAISLTTAPDLRG